MSNEKNTTETAVTEIVDDGQPLALAALERTESTSHRHRPSIPRTISRALTRRRALINMDKGNRRQARLHLCPPLWNETRAGASVRNPHGGMLASQWAISATGPGPEYWRKDRHRPVVCLRLPDQAYYTCVKTRTSLNK